MNEFDCVICGSKVSKRQSYAHGNGRACRAHQEAQQSKETRERLIADRLKADQERTQRRNDRYAVPTQVGPHCWLCRKPGILERDAYALLLVGMAKAELKAKDSGTPMNFLQMMEQASVEAGVAGQTILTQFALTQLTNKQKDTIFKSRMDFDTKMLIDMAGALICCPDCMRRLDLVPPKRPEITHEQLMNHAVVYDVFMKSEVEKIARQEIEKEKAGNQG